MREIKFRAWDKLEKTMREVRSICMVNDYIKNSCEVWSDRSGRRFYFNLYGDNYELMQFTGLKDKNGKEIYEGDILQSTPVKDVRFEIIFGWNTDVNSFGWNMKSHKLPFTYNMDKSVEKMEIIGNVYENPELLEKT